jgi:predicted nucleotidyltransferase
MPFGLSDQDYDLLVRLAIDPLKTNGAKVWVFGSRARGDFRPFSDIDVLFEFQPHHQPPLGLLFNIRDDLEQSNMTLKVDLVDRREIAKSYSEGIEIDKIEV